MEREYALAAMRGAHRLSRTEERRRACVAKRSQRWLDNIEVSISKVSSHILEKDCSGMDVGNDALDGGPEIPLVVVPLPSASDGERLAGVSRHDEIHCPTPASAIEGSGIRPQRRFIQPSLPHLFHQNRDRRDVPFHVADDARSGKGQADSTVKSASARGERQDAGT